MSEAFLDDGDVVTCKFCGGTKFYGVWCRSTDRCVQAADAAQAFERQAAARIALVEAELIVAVEAITEPGAAS